VSWDKRLSANAWKALAGKIQTASVKRASPRFDYPFLRATLARAADRPKWLNV
jgi:hypothetical protein